MEGSENSGRGSSGINSINQAIPLHPVSVDSVLARILIGSYGICQVRILARRAINIPVRGNPLGMGIIPGSRRVDHPLEFLKSKALSSSASFGIKDERVFLHRLISRRRDFKQEQKDSFSDLTAAYRKYFGKFLPTRSEIGREYSTPTRRDMKLLGSGVGFSTTRRKNDTCIVGRRSVVR
jgi:hypothetical protein